MAGSNLILIVQNRTALDRVVDFNESVNAFTTGRATKMARSTQSSETSMCTISAELHRILCTTITQRDSNFRHDHRTTGHALCSIAVCNLSRQRPLLHGWSHHPATTHEEAAIVRVYFLTVHQMSLLVSDHWIAKAEVADFTGSIRSNFGWSV